MCPNHLHVQAKERLVSFFFGDEKVRRTQGLCVCGAGRRCRHRRRRWIRGADEAEEEEKWIYDMTNDDFA